MDAACDVCRKNTGYLLLKSGAYFHARCWSRTHPGDDLDEEVMRNWSEVARASRLAIVAKYGNGKLVTSRTIIHITPTGGEAE